jgi:hypothetical protein
LPLPWLDGQPVVSLQGERLIELEVLWDDLGETDLSSRSHVQTIRIQATQDPAEIRQQSEVLPWVAMQKAGKAIDEATSQVDKGDANAAATFLQEAIASLKKYGPAALVSEAVQQLEKLLAQVRTGALSTRDRKLSKYRSHTYRKMSSSELWSAQGPPPSFKQPPPPTPPPPPPVQDESSSGQDKNQ